MSEPNPDFAEQIRRLEPLTEDEQREFSQEIWQLLERGRLSFISLNHRERQSSVAIDTVPEFGEQHIIISDQPEPEGPVRLIQLKVVRPSVAVLQRLLLQEGRIIDIDSPHELGEVRRGDVESCEELFTHPERYEITDRRPVD